MKHRLAIEQAILGMVAERLAMAAGMDEGSLDAGRTRWAVEARCRHLGLADGDAYRERLEGAPEETAELIDLLVIQETRFFRDPEVFEHIARWAPRTLAEIAAPLRILSAPCSSGQEAYSLAAALSHAGVPLGAVRIDAFDICSTALATAQRGIYPESALKDVTPGLRAASGVLRNHQWRVHDALREAIHFERRNLAEAGALDGSPGYHLILCRNLFIYLHAGARAVLARSLAGALVRGGRLVLGSADRVPEVTEYFAPLKPASSFAFTHAPATKPAEAREGTRGGTGKAASTTAHAPAAKAKSAAIAPSAAEYYCRALEHHEHGNDRQAERRCRQALYLAPGYLPALELLEKLWRLHPNLRLRHALTARIRRVRSAAELDHTVREKESA
jgi:chemotaxis protein methyltransferase WspC